MSKEKKEIPVGEVQGAAPAGAVANTTVGAETSVNDDLLKIISDEVMSLINKASDGIKGESFETVDAALTAAGNDDPFFNPSLSQYREGLIINLDRRLVKIKRATINNSTRKAWVVTAPAGYRKNGEVVYDQAFNFYPSTLRKQIQVTDECGDPVLDEAKRPLVIPENNFANQVWSTARDIEDPKQLLEYALDHVYECIEIKRDFGPSVFIEQKDKSRKATSHKLTSVPLFNRTPVGA